MIACVNCYHHQRGIPEKIHHQEQHGPWLKVDPEPRNKVLRLIKTTSRNNHLSLTKHNEAGYVKTIKQVAYWLFKATSRNSL
jgi:hypothetical protein